MKNLEKEHVQFFMLEVEMQINNTVFRSHFIFFFLLTASIVHNQNTFPLPGVHKVNISKSPIKGTLWGCYILEKIHKSILSMQGIIACIPIDFVFIIKKILVRFQNVGTSCLILIIHKKKVKFNSKINLYKMIH